MGNSIKEEISIMKPKHIFNSILAVLFLFPLMGTFAQQAANLGSIEVISTFDYPGTGNSTLPQKINERGDVVGIFLDSNLVSRGFVRFSDGSFSGPIVDPNDTVGLTEGRGINNSRTIVVMIPMVPVVTVPAVVRAPVVITIVPIRPIISVWVVTIAVSIRVIAIPIARITDPNSY
jgi:hypothetical protein